MNIGHPAVRVLCAGVRGTALDRKADEGVGGQRLIGAEPSIGRVPDLIRRVVGRRRRGDDDAVLELTVPLLAYRDVAERQRSLDRVGDKPAERRHRKRDIPQ